jgi:hypothetical protein
MFSYFALHDPFQAVSRVSGLIFMFCSPRLIFGGTEGVGFRFLVWHFRTHFRRYRGRRVPFSCFALPGPFFAVTRVLDPIFMFCAPGLVFDRYSVPRASSPVFMFCNPGLVLGANEGVKSRFYVFRSRTHFRRYQTCFRRY